MLTIQEYLDLKDWHFCIDVNRGESHGYYYLESRAFRIVDPLRALPKPCAPFRVLVTTFDSDYSGSSYVNSQGWIEACGYALSDVGVDYPDLNFGADCGHLVLDREFTADCINRAMTEFEDLFSMHWTAASDAEFFWQALALLEPFLYFSLSDRLLLIAREESSIDAFLASSELQLVEHRHKESQRQGRLKLWQELGPECGPEVCVVPGCERLRIELAVKCFVHQLTESE